MPCAVCIKGKWCRARILEVESKLNCTIWLVDYGISEIVSWKQLRVLDEIFIKDNEYSFQCSLIDIEPLQSNNYSWTSEAIKKFKRYMKNSNLKIFVHNTKDFCHKVTLFIVKETVDINVNAKMVNYGFAISTGKESLCAENPIVNNELLSNQNLCIKENNSTELITKIINKFDIRSGDTTTVNENKTTKDVLENKKFNQFRTKIRLTSFISPGEFYIQLEKHLSVINKLQKDIQITQMKKLFDNPGSTIKHNWEINENCLAFTKLCNTDNDILQWYRAIIIHIDPDNDNCTIYLRDYGQTIHNIKFDKIAPIDTLFNTVCNTALKCHLACVRPTGGVESWSHSSIDKLNKLIKKFDIISGCIQGERKNDSTPVILWGMISDNSDALIPNNSEWLNINQILVHNGLAHLVEKFDKGQQDLSYLDKEFAEKEKKNKELWLNDVDDISNDVDNYYKVLGHHNPIINNSLNNIIEDSICFEAFDCSEDLENFVSWLPAQPIKKSIFTAIPTYIDGNGYIYLHDARTAYLLDKIKNNINKKFGNYDICLSEKFSWYVGQPCIARFHLDNLYYRGEIINIKADNIKVCFVDYGNVEDCNPNDLIKDLCLTKIPIQATKYELDGIVPNTEDGKWSRDGLDFIQSLIVMKMCSIRISDISINDLIKKCSIRCQNENIIDIIIENNYAIKKTQVFDKLLQSESNKILKKAISRNNTYRQFFSSSEDEDLPDNSENETDILIRVTATENTETRKDSDYYKKLFETKELENFYSTIISGKESDEKVLDNMDDIFQSTNWQKNIEITELSTSDDVKEINDDVNEIKLLSNVDDEDSVSISSFNPKETSTEISRFDGIDNFTRSELPYCVKDFYCQINYILDGTNFYIHPLLAEHEKVYFDMTRKIQLYAKTASPILEISPKIPCLAVYNEDNLWYRAIIRTHHPNTDTVDVIYVDYLNSDTVPVTKIRKCPHQIIKYPLRLMQVRLSGLRPNPRWRHSDIIRRLSSELLRKRKVYVKVIKNGKIPEVKLLESQTNSSLVLQKLISERFYLLETRKSK